MNNTIPKAMMIDCLTPTKPCKVIWRCRKATAKQKKLFSEAFGKWFSDMFPTEAHLFGNEIGKRAVATIENHAYTVTNLTLSKGLSSGRHDKGGWSSMPAFILN